MSVTLPAGMTQDNEGEFRLKNKSNYKYEKAVRLSIFRWGWPGQETARRKRGEPVPDDPDRHQCAAGTFVITTEACLDYLQRNASARIRTDGVRQRCDWQTRGSDRHRTFGAGSDPLLVSVRSGSAMSMPGMMDTILNLGLNDETLASLIQQRPVTSDSCTTPIVALSSYLAKWRWASTMKNSMCTSRRSRNSRWRQRPMSALEASHLREISNEVSGRGASRDRQRISTGRDDCSCNWRLNRCSGHGLGKRAVDYRKRI